MSILVTVQMRMARYGVQWFTFVSRRCFLETKHRVDMDKHIFVALSRLPEDHPILSTFSGKEEILLEDVLDIVHDEWDANVSVADSDSPAPDVSEWHKVVSVKGLPDVPSRGEGPIKEYEWNLITGRHWMKWLARLLRRIREATARSFDVNSEGAGVQTEQNETFAALVGLCMVLCSVLRLPLAKMFDIPPINVVLERYCELQVKCRSCMLSDNCPALSYWGPPNHGPPRHDQYLDLHVQSCESALSLVLRYLNNIVAWYRAASYTGAMSRRHAPERLKLGFVETHPAPIPVAELQFELLFRKAFWIRGRSPEADAKFKDKMDRLSSILKIDLEELKSPPEFYGTVHPEAALMGLIYADKAAYKVRSNPKFHVAPEISLFSSIRRACSIKTTSAALAQA